MLGCLRWDWISISRRSWCSTCDCCSCCLNRTLRATMYLLFFSRARYTLPNLPRPRGLPMSKSLSCGGRERGGCQHAKDGGGCEGAPNFVFCVSVCDVRGNPPRRRRATASRLGRGSALSRGYRVDTYLPTLLLLLNGRTGARGRRRGARGGGVLLAGTARGRCTRGLHDGRRLLERSGRVGGSGGHSGAVRVPLVCR